VTAHVNGIPLAALLATAALAGPAFAQNFEHDTGQPIEITADSLEVVQADRLATFAGNVDAVQGDVVLSADRLKVFYRGSGDPAGDGAGGSIRRIEALGNVVVTSPRETAAGDAGTYDVGASQITLEGGVVLTREENVIRGDRLELDLTTGVSRVVASTTASEGAPPEQRVRAVFSPSEGAEGEAARGSKQKTSQGDAGKAKNETAKGTSAATPIPKQKPAADAAPER
jgi:lipopolysaccharide export system protein LptA